MCARLPVTGGWFPGVGVGLPPLPQHDTPLSVLVGSPPAYSSVGPLSLAVLQSSIVLVD